MCHGQIISSAIVKARKAHTCDECGRAINKGGAYLRQAERDGSEFMASKTCLRCTALGGVAVSESGESCVFGAVREELRYDLEALGGWRKLRAEVRRRMANLVTRYSKRSDPDAV